MRAADVLIAWTPAECAYTSPCPDLRATAGSVALIPWSDAAGRARAYAKTATDCEAEWRAASPESLVARVFITFNTMVLRDGVSPLTAHVNFMDLDEYRQNISPDLLAQRGRPCRSAAIIDLARRRAEPSHSADRRSPQARS